MTTRQQPSPGAVISQAAVEKVSKRIRSLKSLTPFLRPYRARMAIALTALVIASLVTLLLGQGLRHIVDQGVP
jgi:ATP-binding cassette subfamily B protein